MHKKLIKKGHSYSDRKGNVRLVVAEYENEFEDTVEYKVTAKRSGPYLLGSKNNCTRTAFARWAKEEAK